MLHPSVPGVFGTFSPGAEKVWPRGVNVFASFSPPFCSGSTKHSFWPMVCRGLGGWGATQEPTQYFLALCSSKTAILGIQRHLVWLMVYSGTGGWEATPKPTRYVPALCSSKTPILGIPKTQFLAHGVWWYGWLGRHPRTHTKGSRIVQFKDTHPRDPKTQFLAHGMQWYGWLRHHSTTHTI